LRSIFNNLRISSNSMPDNVTPIVSDALFAGREEEALFARDDNDVLVRREKETQERFKEMVTIVIDGYSVQVPRAVPKTDAQGNFLRDADGELVPRTTTIHDAAVELVESGIWTEDVLKSRIPVLCHQRHVPPIGVCRMCSVHISSVKRGKLTPGRKLVPACQHRVEKDMVVTTRAGATGYNPQAKESVDLKSVERFSGDVNNSVKLLAEFLLADHWRAQTGPKRYEDELGAVATTLGVSVVRDRLKRAEDLPGRNKQFVEEGRARRISLPLVHTNVEREKLSGQAQQAWEEWNESVDENCPYSSRTVVVDHDRCIVCDRCVRACSEVKPFKVIGHTGKGYNTRISFDLDSIMGQSSCVQCGECMTSCPTGALSLRRRVQPRAWNDSPEQIPVNPNTPFPTGSEFLTADEMRNVWLLYNSPTRGPLVVFPFQSVPYAYLKWNEGSVRRWEIQPGEQKVLCKESEYGSTAFLLQGTGMFEVYSRRNVKPQKQGFFSRLFGRSSTANDGLGSLVRVAPNADELILGEMACLTQRPRVASVVVAADANNPRLILNTDATGRSTATVDPTSPGPMVIYEITRNLLDMIQRSASAREHLQEMYTARAIDSCLKRGRIFANLPLEDQERAVAFLLKEGTEFRRVAAGEIIVREKEPARDFYIIRVGTVRVYSTVNEREQVLSLLSEGDHFGEMALLSDRPGMRKATVAALDPVELVRISGPTFRAMCKMFPAMRDDLLSATRTAAPGIKGTPTPGILGEYVRQGLFQGQRLLVLDLNSCTRCDECTRACADSHDGNARLLREGLRFGDFLVATSCRSCRKPYCMDGCPVDAIHRRGTHLEVKIENHCIGCGLCERNCPYGAIHMVARDTPNPAAASVPGGNPTLTAARRAVNCDLCNGGEPFCVEACPHEAAYRTGGPELLDEVLNRLKKSGK
jgi:Fe-S-cluster-containing hydrogenase component 2/CRP-like cAMP-binding protein